MAARRADLRSSGGTGGTRPQSWCCAVTRRRHTAALPAGVTQVRLRRDDHVMLLPPCSLQLKRCALGRPTTAAALPLPAPYCALAAALPFASRHSANAGSTNTAHGAAPHRQLPSAQERHRDRGSAALAAASAAAVRRMLADADRLAGSTCQPQRCGRRRSRCKQHQHQHQRRRRRQRHLARNGAAGGRAALHLRRRAACGGGGGRTAAGGWVGGGSLGAAACLSGGRTGLPLRSWVRGPEAHTYTYMLPSAPCCALTPTLFPGPSRAC